MPMDWVIRTGKMWKPCASMLTSRHDPRPLKLEELFIESILEQVPKYL